MNDIFLDLLDICIVVYFNNILIYLDDMSQHQEYIKEVLYQLHKTGLYAKAEKCKFYSNFVECLEYILSLSRLTMSFNKINMI